MPKGYWIGRVDVKSDEGYKPYAAGNQAIFRKFGGRYVIRAGKFECAEGTARSRNVVLNSLTMRPHSPVTVRLNINRT